MPPKSTEQELEQELRNEIERFNIEFLGLLLPSEWPTQHAETFKNVRKAGTTSWEPDDLASSLGDSDSPERRRSKIRALKLTKKAIADRKDRVNEPTLRGNAEPLVFKRFAKALKWCSINTLSTSPSMTDSNSLVNIAQIRYGVLRWLRNLPTW